LHTPYNPPYLADLLGASMTSSRQTVLLHLPVKAQPEPVEGPATLRPATLAELTDALSPLLAAAIAPHAGMPGLSADAAELLVRWISVYPATGWVALIEGEAVGCIFVQADLAPMRQRRTTRGRLLFGAVAPAWRRRGVGRQLLGRALSFAAEAGWRTLVCGPFVDSSPAVTCLQKAGAHIEQRYELFELDG
jgi:GNAT superfamily N-acetyltransferase